MTVHTSRVLRVPLTPLSDASWTALRALAREGAAFCNACLADAYAQRLGYQPPNAQSVFRRCAGSLSGDVRVALAREAFTTWRRHGGKILSGAQRLAMFDADRALVCRAEHLSKGRRQIHARVSRVGTDYQLSARLVGKHRGGPHVFQIALDPRCDDYVRPVIEGLAAGDVRLLKLTIVFERPGRKVFVLLTYERHMEIPAAGEGVATLGPLEEDGTLWLRWEDAGRPRSQNYTAWISRLSHVKHHFSGIHQRLRARLRRSGAGHRRVYREALVKAGSFGAWAHGELHRCSADIVRLCRERGIGTLQVAPLEHHELPMAELVAKLTYKCAEAGIGLTRIDPATASGSRAMLRPVAKRQRSVTRARAALDTLRTVVAQTP